MAGVLEADDPATRSLVLDLFTDIMVLEHLVRERFTPSTGGLDARQFGIINYMVRQKRPSEKLASLAWSFQVEAKAMLESVEALSQLKLVEVDWVDGERCIFLTQAGRDRHERFVAETAPDVVELLSEIDPAALRVTAETLKELRRTFDNLPDR